MTELLSFRKTALPATFDVSCFHDVQAIVTINNAGYVAEARTGWPVCYLTAKEYGDNNALVVRDPHNQYRSIRYLQLLAMPPESATVVTLSVTDLNNIIANNTDGIVAGVKFMSSSDFLEFIKTDFNGYNYLVCDFLQKLYYIKSGGQKAIRDIEDGFYVDFPDPNSFSEAQYKDICQSICLLNEFVDMEYGQDKVDDLKIIKAHTINYYTSQVPELIEACKVTMELAEKFYGTATRSAPEYHSNSIVRSASFVPNWKNWISGLGIATPTLDHVKFALQHDWIYFNPMLLKFSDYLSHVDPSNIPAKFRTIAPGGGVPLILAPNWVHIVPTPIITDFGVTTILDPINQPPRTSAGTAAKRPRQTLGSSASSYTPFEPDWRHVKSKFAASSGQVLSSNDLNPNDSESYLSAFERIFTTTAADDKELNNIDDIKDFVDSCKFQGFNPRECYTKAIKICKHHNLDVNVTMSTLIGIYLLRGTNLQKMQNRMSVDGQQLLKYYINVFNLKSNASGKGNFTLSHLAMSFMFYTVKVAMSLKPTPNIWDVEWENPGDLFCLPGFATIVPKDKKWDFMIKFCKTFNDYMSSKIPKQNQPNQFPILDPGSVAIGLARANGGLDDDKRLKLLEHVDIVVKEKDKNGVWKFKLSREVYDHLVNIMGQDKVEVPDEMIESKPVEVMIQ